MFRYAAAGDLESHRAAIVGEFEAAQRRGLISRRGNGRRAKAAVGAFAGSGLDVDQVMLTIRRPLR